MAEGPSNSGTGGAIAAGMTPIAGLIGSFLGYRSAKKNTERTIQANRELAEYKYAKDLEMWNRQNEYNSPQAQMERLKAAGLNPNLIYGSGGGNTGNASSMPNYNAPTADYTGIPSPVAGAVPHVLQMYQDMKMKQAQTDNIQAQTDLTNVKTALEAGVGKALKEKELDTKDWRLAIAQHVDPLKASITRSQMDAAKHLEAVAIAKLNNILQQNRNLIAQEAGTTEKTKSQRSLNLWLEKGITPADNFLIRALGKAFSNEELKRLAGKLAKFGAPIFNK